MATNDAELLERWTTVGDARAFDSLVAGYSGLVYSACRRILGNDADAQDATQECFLQLAQRTPKIQTSLAAWLHTVATRKAISRIREETRRTRREQSYAKDANTTVEADWDDIQEFIDEAIRALPAENRVPVVACFLERKTHAEIAKEIGIDRSTVSRRIDRGIEGIRDHLKDKGVIATSASLLTMLTTKMTEAMPVGLTGALGKIALSGGRLQVAGDKDIGGRLGLPDGTITGKMASGFLAALMLIGGAWWWGSRERHADPVIAVVAEAPSVAEPNLEISNSAISPQASDSEMTGAAGSMETVKLFAATVTKPFGAGVEGRVFDATTNQGLDGVVISAYVERESPEVESHAVATAESANGGHFFISGLGVGAYILSTDELEGYPRIKSARVEILSASDAVTNISLALEPGGVLTGVAVLGNEPLRDARIKIDSYSSKEGYYTQVLGQLVTQTDRRGRFRIEGLRDFDGSLIAKRTQANGSTQDALVIPATIRPGEETDVTFDFISGTASIEGRVYFQNEETPIAAGIQVFFGWEDNGTYREEIIRARADDTGYYIVEGLPAGNAEIHVSSANTDPIIRRTETIVLTEDQRAVKNIVLTAMSVQCHVTNVPARTVVVFLLAHPGDVEIEITDVASFMALRNTMVTYDQLYAGGTTPLQGELVSLKPGRYTISASAWPAEYSFAAIQAYGMDKFIEDMRTVSTVIDVTEADQVLDVHFDFDTP